MIVLEKNHVNDPGRAGGIEDRDQLLRRGIAAIEASIKSEWRAKHNERVGGSENRPPPDASSSKAIGSPYMQDLSRSQPLDRDAEKALFKHLGELRAMFDRLAECCHEADAARKERVERQLISVRNQIAVANLRLVASIARKFAKQESPEFHEMVSKGHEILLRAIDLFDVDHGTKFSTYATTAIRRTCWQHCRNESQHRERFVGADQETVAAVQDESAPLTAWSEVPENALGLKAMLDELPDRDRRIVVARFGLDGDRASTLQKIADRMNLSKERVRQLLIRALESLRKSAIRHEIDPPEIG